MRIVSESDQQLILEHKPMVLPAIAAVLAFAVLAQALRSPGSVSLSGWVGTVLGSAVAGFIAYLMALPSRVVFDAGAGEVSWHHKGWPGRAHGRRKLDEITGVEVASRSPGGDGAGRVTLLTAEGPIPLTRDFWGIGRHEQTAKRIREWLGQHGAGADVTE